MQRAANRKPHGPGSHWFPLYPAFLLRAEGALLLTVSAALFFHRGGPWPLFLALLLSPDLAMLGYLAGPRVGAATYNLAHSYLLPAALAAVSFASASQLGVLVALVWLAHIGMDRAVGYGLKFPSGFRDTHLS